MSDARVTFHRLEDLLEDLDAVPGEEQTFSFTCPRGRRCAGLIIAGRTTLKRDAKSQNDGIAQWDWDGNREHPTFSPSIDCKSCWHGYIRNGQCVDA